MMDLLTIALEAHSDEHNHHRRYEVSIGRDLLHHWTVTIRYGRVGQSMQRMQFADPRPEAMRAVVAERLRRRLSAHRRLGCPYLVRGLSLCEGMNVDDWIAADLLRALVVG